MDFKNRIKKGIYIWVAYMLIGAAFVILSLTHVIQNEFIMSYGAALVVASVVRIIQRWQLLKNDNAMKKHETAAKDERNIMLVEKSRSMAYTIFIIAASIALVILEILNIEFAALIIAYTVCALVIIYTICRFIYSRIY